MSTRSGKRIHNSLLEDTAPTEQELVVKSERKTRSKRVKENLDELSVSLFKSKKRNNYVSYPTDDELLGDVTTSKDDEVIKPSRALRKIALKEQNPPENIKNTETKTDAKNLIRKSRRGKKKDDLEETENHENVPVPALVTETTISKKSKKKKRRDTVDDNPPPMHEAPAKKSKKKKKVGKQKSSMIVEDVPQYDKSKNNTLNKSNMSIDSFHSAAGSPLQQHDNVVQEDNTDNDNKLNKSATKKPKKISNHDSFDKNNEQTNMSVDTNEDRNTVDKGFKKKRQSLSNDMTLGECFVVMTRDNLEKDLKSILNVPNLSNGQLNKRKSSSRDVTLNKSNISAHNDHEKVEESNLNVSTKQLKKRKSNVKKEKDVLLSENIENNLLNKNDDTFCKGLRSRSSIGKDVTFDKSNSSMSKEIMNSDVGIDFNVSNISTKNLSRRKSVLKDNTFDKSSDVGIDFNVSNISTKNLSRRKSVLKDNTFDKSSDVGIDFNVSNISNKNLSRRKSVLKDNTFDKSSSSVTKDSDQYEFNISNKELKARKSAVIDSTFDKSNASSFNFEKDTEDAVYISSNTNKNSRRCTSDIKDSTFDKPEQVINTSFEKVLKRDSTFDKNKNFNTTDEKDLDSDFTKTKTINRKGKNPSVNTTDDRSDTTFEKDSSTSFDAFKKGAMTRKSSMRDATFDKSETSIVSLSKEDFERDNIIVSSSAKKQRSNRRNTFDKTDIITENGNISYENTSIIENEPKRKLPRTSKSSDIQIKLNTTFEKENLEDKNEKENSKLSLISSDNSSIDKSNISRISITSDNTTEHIENIINTTPLLIESSMEESHNSLTKKESPKPQTPLKREGTFTKDGPEIQTENELQTPTKCKSFVPAAGCTPYHVAKSSQKKTILNVTRSIEKGVSASVDPAPRMTRVMFCSPVDNPVMATQEKRKIIKSNLKGSNKSFVFEETASASRPGRKRSYTHGDADEARSKRTRLTEDLQHSVDRLSRPRTTSAIAKLSVTTPKRATPSKAKSDVKSTRTKLPNFAAVHQKQFDKMESLNECQERRAKRAKQLLTPTAPPGLLDRISPKSITESPKGKELAKPKEKTDTPTKKPPTLDTLRPGFTRFGFKLNMDVNPFSIPSKTEKPKEKQVEQPTDVPPRPALLPSLVGATSVRRETAKLAVMREKSFTGKRSANRNDTRTIIKGVRTNRRFELQMKMRNIE